MSLSTRARIHGVAAISDVALLKRLRSSEAWLAELARQMFATSRFRAAAHTALSGRRLRAIDATTMEEPGATGTDWRVHYSVSLPDLRCDFFALTDGRGAETFKRFPIAPGDVLLADRGYCCREGVAHVVKSGGDVVMRMSSTSFPLVQPQHAQAFDTLAHLRELVDHGPGQWPVRYVSDGETLPARLCAVRKSAAAAELAKKKLLRRASKKQQKLRPETLEFAEYVMTLTTLPTSTLDAAGVLELYRALWQVELCFKRMKSLMLLGHLPKRSGQSARAWIQGKLLTVLIIEQLTAEARSISPWGYPLHEP